MDNKKETWSRIKAAGKRDFSDSLGAVSHFLKWLVLGVGIGLVVGAAASAFGYVLSFANTLRAGHPWLKFFLPLGGLLIVLMYRVCKNTQDRGTNTVLASVQTGADISLKTAPLIFLSTTVTQLFGGSAGREGAVLQLGSSIAKNLGKLLRLSKDDQRAIVMCGMSAGFSALFGTPMAAAVFSIEVASVGIMRYSALLPCVIASMSAHFVADFARLPPEVFPVSGIPAITPAAFLKIIAFAAAAALVSVLFCLLLHKTEHLYAKVLKNPYIRIVVGGCAVVLLSVILGTDAFLGSGMGIIEEIFETGSTAWYTFLLKMLFTALTLGAGFKGGEIVPSFCIGAALGCAAASILGLPAQLTAACGMVGLFCGVTNAPIASLLIAFELFGYEGMPYYLTTVAVSFLLSGCNSLYHQQKFNTNA